MDSRIKDIIKKIVKIDISNPVDILGDVAADILFKKGKSAFFVNNENNKVALLLPPNTKSYIRKEEILLLTELLAVLQNLENKGLIYVDDTYSLPQYLFYQGKDMFEKDQRPGVYKVSDQTILKYHNDSQVALMVNEEKLLCVTAVFEHIGLSLARFLCSVVIPTRSLNDYVRRGFKTKEERNTQLGLRYSIISMTIAVLIAAISPIISVLISNKYGFSTIREDQMDSILKVSKPVYFVQSKDSVQQYCNKNNVLRLQKGKEHGK